MLRLAGKTHSKLEWIAVLQCSVKASFWDSAFRTLLSNNGLEMPNPKVLALTKY
jgi:hypothetical protein